MSEDNKVPQIVDLVAKIMSLDEDGMRDLLLSIVKIGKGDVIETVIGDVKTDIMKELAEKMDKVSAIKEYRWVTGSSLKEAIDVYNKAVSDESQIGEMK